MQHDETTASTDTAGWRSIPQVFADHARRDPDTLAVEANGERRSYAELAARVETFAARLGTGAPERLIGVCLARDVDLPAWLLAILWVGAAYLPIDPTIPPARLAPMLEDAQPVLIVASRRHAHVVADVGVLVLIAEDAGTASAPPPLATITARHLAYVIFTSGSTGRPKGVEIEHGSLVALMATMAVSPGFARGERMLGLTRVSFDLSVPDMFLPFFTGGSLALVEQAVAADPERLAAAFAQYRPDLAQGTPSTWRALLEHGWTGLPGLRILAGGETMTRALADRLLPCCGALWNIYGPTETTVWSTACRVEPGTGPIPIGWPLTGIAVQVADDMLAPVADGVVGEIVIGGAGVARGYRHRPELTAERFVRLADGSRAYRTGDLGRVDATGALFCLGRLDDQVKVRGFRIELGDVEAALALHPGIAWSAVRVWTDPSGEPTLVGYVVPCAGTVLDTRTVKAFLASRLAAYMIPDRIVSAAAMPLTPNGKVDRAALPNPFTTAAAATPVADSVTARLAAIWSALLGISDVADDDDFFDLGGYSLMTVRLARRIEADFGVRLAPIELLRHATLAAMAARIVQGEVPGAATMLLNAGGSRPPLFWLDAGPLMRTMARGLSTDQPCLALNTDAADEAALGTGELSIPAIATRLKRRLMAEQPVGPYYIGGWCRWGIVALELAAQLIAAGESVALLVLLDAERPGHRPRPGLRTRVARLLRRHVPDEATSFSQRVELATHGYRPARYPGDVLLLRPADSIGDAGWGAIVDGTLLIERTPGDHITMVRGTPVLTLAATLDEALYSAQQRWAEPARSVEAVRMR
ncbi:amino acid adenylation domain-containing protein [Sphingomonas sp. PB1R3]